MKLPYSANNPDIAIGRHAVSIDERRAFFRTNLWRPDPPSADSGPKDLKQVWFPGVHCDVGGGYPEAESGLSKFALEWMVREAALVGLLIDLAETRRNHGTHRDEIRKVRLQRRSARIAHHVVAGRRNPAEEALELAE